MIVGIDHVQIRRAARLRGRSAGVYGGLLGLSELPKPEALAGRGGVARLACGAQQLHVGVQLNFVPAAKAHPALGSPTAASLELLVERLAGAGHLAQPDAPNGGGPRVHVRDPFGNRLELLTSA